MEAQEVIVRLCKLHTEVAQSQKFNSSADCFCGEGGFWGTEGYDGTFEGGYRNDGEALEFIETVVRERLAAIGEE